MASFLSLCSSMRCSCIYIVGAVFLVFMNNWSGIQDCRNQILIATLGLLPTHAHKKLEKKINQIKLNW